MTINFDQASMLIVKGHSQQYCYYPDMQTHRLNNGTTKVKTYTYVNTESK